MRSKVYLEDSSVSRRYTELKLRLILKRAETGLIDPKDGDFDRLSALAPFKVWLAPGRSLIPRET